MAKAPPLLLPPPGLPVGSQSLPPGQAPPMQNSPTLREGSLKSNSPRPRPANQPTDALAPARVTMTTGKAR